jgi:DNA-directed RNA polymerase specialized sigma24 family protein
MSHAPQVARESPGTPRGQPDDAGLIAESCRVPERFGAVFDRHAAAIHGYIARRLGRDAADDLVAETFLVAFRQRSGYDPDQPSARPWLYGIATRLISRRRRDEVRFFHAIARTGIDPAADPVAEPVADVGARRADAQTLHRAPGRGAGRAAGGRPGRPAAGR